MGWLLPGQTVQAGCICVESKWHIQQWKGFYKDWYRYAVSFEEVSIKRFGIVHEFQINQEEGLFLCKFL
jgi:hypothetical protein